MSFVPFQACLGGVFIGVACGAYMYFAERVAGNSGALKALVVGPREPPQLAFLSGLAAAGALMSRLLPAALDPASSLSPTLLLGGLLVGLGTALGNRCDTSRHGLCGLSRL